MYPSEIVGRTVELGAGVPVRPDAAVERRRVRRAAELGGDGMMKLSSKRLVPRSKNFMSEMLARRSTLCPMMIAVVTSCVSFGAIVNGPLESMSRRSAGLVSSQPVPRTGSPLTTKSVTWFVTGLITGVPSAFNPFM
jgi:hypothetical protein